MQSSRPGAVTDVCDLSATALARLMRAKELSAREAVVAHLSRIDAINPKVNAIVTLVAERALQQAQAADDRLARGESIGPLHGLPIAHKDLQATAGIRTTFGSPMFRDYVPDQDSPLVAALRQAGAIVVGKTNTPELGAGSQTFNPIFGPTRNPYDLTKTCGGSSGGAAVALACRMLPIADGTDMGGSLRNPAAFCGVVGLRPSVRFLQLDDLPAWSSLGVDGPMARKAEDVALLLGALIGRRPPSLERDVKGTRVAWWIDFGGLPFDPRVTELVNAQRSTFESMGCSVEAAEPSLASADEIFKTLRAHAFLTTHGAAVRRHRDLVKATVLEETDRGERLTAAEVVAAERARADLRAACARFMERYDFFVLPTTQVPPFDVGQPYPREINGVAMDSYIDWMKSCYFISVLGYPAVSVPCGLTAEGLPVGLQIVGRDGEDWRVLQLAHAFELARGPFPMPTALS